MNVIWKEEKFFYNSKRTFIRLLAIVFSSFLYADVFQINYPNEDLSLTYLNYLFGPLSNTGLYLVPNALHYLLVKILIFPLLFASFMSAWIVFTGTLRSAQEGTFLGQKLGATTVIVRGVIGMGLLTPDHTGYAMIQRLMMTIIISGIGLANSVWSLVTEQYAKGMSLMQNVEYDTSDQQYTKRMIAYAALLGYLKSENMISGYDWQSDPYTFTYEQIRATAITPATDPSPLNLFYYSNTKDPVIPSEALSATEDLTTIFMGQPFVQILIQWMIQNPSEVINVPEVFTKAGISSEDLDAWMINNYSITRQQMQIINQERSNSIDPYLKDGWIVAGSIYWKLSTSEGPGTSYCTYMNYAPTTGVPQGSTSNLQYWLEQLSSTRFEGNPILSTSIGNIQDQVGYYGGNPDNGRVNVNNPIDARVTGIDFSFTALNNVFDAAMNDGVDPIISFAKNCQRMMKAVLVFFISSLLVIGAMSFIAVMRYQLPFVHLMVYMLGSVLLLMLSFSFIFIPPSAMGGYYLPTIPLLIYTGAAIAWLIKTVEAIVAAPFVAVALIEPTQDEFGRAKAALVLTLHVMLKPVLMVIGLFLGGRIAVVAFASVALPLSAFLTYRAFLLSATNVVLERVLFYILLNQVVVGIVVALVTRSFSLIYKIPDQVFGWIGDRGQNSDVAAMVSEAHQGAEQGIQMMNQIFQIGTSVGKVSLEAMKTLSKSS